MTRTAHTEDDAPTLKDVDHTHPHTNRTFGGNFAFARGGAVADDGGRPDVVPEDAEGATADAEDVAEPRVTLGGVEHVPPNGNGGANAVFARGEREHERDGRSEQEHRRTEDE